MLVAAFFVGSMVIWMWRAGGNARGEIEGKLDAMVGTEGSDSRGWPLLLLSFFLILREGVEIVIFVAAIAAGQSPVLALAGALGGLALAFLFGWLLIRGSMRINLKRFFSVSSIVLLLLVLKLIASSIHEMAEQQWIPMSKALMNFLGYFVRDDSSLLIVLALLALPVLVIILDWQRAPVGSPSSTEGAAERRKRLAAARNDRKWRVALGASTLAIVLGLSVTTFGAAKSIDPVPQPAPVVAQSVRLPLSTLEAGVLHKFVVSLDGTDVRFLVAKLKDGSLGTALDACNICGAVGYMQDGENAICKNCNAPIAMNTFGLGGGCNPKPIASTVEGDELVIPLSVLEGAISVFGGISS